jgi:uncharacterized membrane protein YqjE
MRIKNQKDFWAGIMFIAFGAFFSGLGTQYSIGTAARMRPGYFPTAVGVITILLGTVISVGGLSAKATEEKVPKFNFLTLLLILGPVVLFGLLLQPLGLIVSMLVLIVISSYGSHEFSWKATLANALVLIVMCLVVFVWGLKLPFHLWPSFINN